MMTSRRIERTSDERLLSGLAHGGIILNFLTSYLGGLIAALIIWLTQRDKSRWVAFQALQALIYQALGFLITVLVGILWFILIFASAFASVPLLIEQSSGLGVGGMFVSVWGGLCFIFLLMLAWMLYGLWGALKAYSGEDFRYLIIGDWLARRMGNRVLTTTAAGTEEQTETP